MLIGALIGFLISMLIIAAILADTTVRIQKLKDQGHTSITPRYPWPTWSVNTAIFTTVGAIIGYFVS